MNWLSRLLGRLPADQDKPTTIAEPNDEPVAAYLPGWSSLVEWFGYSPNFHDSEVISVDLRREPEPSVIRVHVWHTTNEVTERGVYRQERHAHAVFSITKIIELKLEG